MSIDLSKARDFVYRNGTLFERALFAWLFDGGSQERLQQIILCYKNADNGFGHGFEHDLKAPQSHPLALEYLLGVMKHCDMPPGPILEGSATWVESQMDDEGNLGNPPEIRDYPHQWWWREKGGQTMPDSIVGNLIRFGCASPSLIEKARRWVRRKVTLDSIRDNEWLFMAYHTFDFFFAVDDFPDLERYQQATVDNIIACAIKAPENQFDSLFAFAPTPASPIARALPDGLVGRFLDTLAASQQDAGHWVDQHSLSQWFPMTTINVLLALRRYGRW